MLTEYLLLHVLKTIVLKVALLLHVFESIQVKTHRSCHSCDTKCEDLLPWQPPSKRTLFNKDTSSFSVSYHLSHILCHAPNIQATSSSCQQPNAGAGMKQSDQSGIEGRDRSSHRTGRYGTKSP